MSAVNVELVFLQPSDGGRAWKFAHEDGDTLWLPDSQIAFDYSAQPGAVVDVEMPEWLALKEGLI